MNILHISQRYWPYGGGVEYHLQKINEQLVADGHTVSVLTLFDPLDSTEDQVLPKHEDHHGVQIIRLKKYSLPTFLPKNLPPFILSTYEKFHLWFSILRVLPQFKMADVVQVHDVFWWILPFFWLIPGKVYMTFHGYENELGPTKSQRRWHRLAEILTDGNLAIGGFHTKWYGVTPDVISYGAVDVLNSNQEKLSREKDKFTLMFIGRLSPHTGAQELVTAVDLVPKQTKEKISVVIYGQGELFETLEKEITSKQLPIQLKGFDPDARKHLADADCVFVSQYLAILEALVAGKSIISYASSDFKEDVLRMTPYSESLQIIRTPEELAHKISQTLLQKGSHAESQIAQNQLQQHWQSWAQSQTWKELTACYYRLWKKR